MAWRLRQPVMRDTEMVLLKAKVQTLSSNIFSKRLKKEGLESADDAVNAGDMSLAAEAEKSERNARAWTICMARVRQYMVCSLKGGNKGEKGWS